MINGTALYCKLNGETLKKKLKGSVSARGFYSALPQVARGTNKMFEISKDKLFDAKSIFECGQVFRYEVTDEGYLIYADRHCALVKSCERGYIIDSTDDEFFENYFDLSTDYQGIIDRLQGNDIMKLATNFGKGIRILRQNKYEMLISFIVSSNNHIPRIRKILNRLCEELGEKREFMGHEYHSFPTPNKMAERDVDFYTGIGLGYRAKYIEKTAKDIAAGFDLEAIGDMPTEKMRKKLCSLMGVGPKVADCIMLFAYNRCDAFPVDTWMEKVYFEYFDSKPLSAKQISEYFVDRFRELSGYAQQYLFYYKRENS